MIYKLTRRQNSFKTQEDKFHLLEKEHTSVIKAVKNEFLFTECIQD